MGFDGHVGLIGDFMGLFFWNFMDFAGGLMGFNGFCFFLVMIFHGVPLWILLDLMVIPCHS